MKILKSFKKSLIILNFIFFCAFICHIIIIGYGLKNPSIPNVKVYHKDFKDIEFPLIFKLCVRELENGSQRYMRLGYEEERSYYYGILNPENKTFNLYTNYGEKMVGWNGYANGSSVGSVEGEFCPETFFLSCILTIVILEVLSKASYNWREIVREVQVWTPEHGKI